MSKRVILTTGEKVMTEGNALRHFLKRAEIALANNDYGTAYCIWNEAAGIVDTALCSGCCQDDIGYCGLRHNSDISEPEKFMKYCFPSVIHNWKNSVNYMDNKSKHKGKGLEYKDTRGKYL